MRVYFTADESADEKLQKRFSELIGVLTNAGVLVMSNLADKNIAGFSSTDLDKLEQTGEAMLEKMDALIIEGTKPLAESGYLIALSLAHKKPILYLSDKTKPINKNLFHLKKDKNTGKLLNLEYYTEKTLEKVILDFLQGVAQGTDKQVPNIKFTLRITPRIEKYLHWKTHNTKISKADFLREKIEKMIDDDQDYLRYISRHDNGEQG